jgi:ABC-type nitrate/sulfonate/bicarbonate transport system ATPase subunit
VVIIILSIIFERVVMWLTEQFFAWQPSCKKSRGRYASGAHVIGAYHDEPEHDGHGHGMSKAPAIRTVGLSKAFDGKTVLENVDAKITEGEICYLTEPSGSGKTTFLRLVAGLLKPDSGTIEVNGRVSMMFQEDRLCDHYSAIKNVELVLGSEALAAEALGRILPEDSLRKPCESLSGGMKRRVALCRAVESDSDILLLDEPFTGLDAATRANVENYIKDRAGERTILIVTHV